MKVLCVPLGPVEANCYVVIDQERALVIDPSGSFPDLDKILKSNHARLEAVLLTHAHFDHIGGLDEMLERYGVDVYLNPLEFDFLKNASLNSSSTFGGYLTSKAVPKPLYDGSQSIGGFEVTAMTLPGHTVGSTVIAIGNDLFTGDVLFQGSVGRTDLATGSWSQMIQSIQYLKKLPDDTIVYPGHGPSTTIGQEKQWNPYFR